jgi:hypothetical protein
MIFPEAGVLKKLAGLAESAKVHLTKVWWALADYRGLRDHFRPVYTADLTEKFETSVVSPLRLADRD